MYCLAQISNIPNSVTESTAFQADTTTEISFRTTGTNNVIEPRIGSDVTDSNTVINGESTTAMDIKKEFTTKVTAFESSTTIQPDTATSDVLKKWQHLENITKIFMKDAVKKMLPGLMDGTGNMNISDSCRRDALRFIIGLREAKAWAFSCKYNI